MARWWKVFLDRLTGRASDPEAQGPRRRAHERFTHRAPIEARCSSWPRFANMVTGDVSNGGLFIPTVQPAHVGDRIEVRLTLPDESQLIANGTIVSVVDVDHATRVGRTPGIGIKLDPMEGEAKTRFDALVARAREAAPKVEAAESAPASSPTRPPAPAPAPAAPARTRIIGIDLGTTYTSVAAARNNKVTVLKRPDGSRSVPSVLSFPDARQIVIGDAARARLTTDPGHTVVSPKRLLGRRYDDREIEPFLCQAAYTTSRAPDDSVLVEMWGEKYPVTQLCALLLADARDAAERALGEKVGGAVLTVPVTFDERRLELLRRAAKLARLEVAATIDEPSAAALANRFLPGFGGTVGVYDFGGGTFDFTIVDASSGDFKVLATAGDSWLGGDDFDIALAESVASQIFRMHQIDLHKQAVEWQRLLFACEKAKRQLSNEEVGVVHLPELLRGKDGMIDVNYRLNRETFEKIVSPVIERSLTTCDQALALLGMDRMELSSIFLSGGTTYVPAVRSAIERRFGVPAQSGVPAEHAVALGAGIHAAQLEAHRATTLDQNAGPK